MTIPDSSGYDLLMENGSIQLPCKPEEERRVVKELTAKADATLREGDSYYVISSRWFSAWKRYTGITENGDPFKDSSSESKDQSVSFIEDRPGPIDNSDIVVNGKDNREDDPQLLRNLEEMQDYELVPQGVWEKLLEWYKGGPVLRRNLISGGDQHKTLFVEVYPLRLRLIDSRDQTATVIRLSRKASVEELYSKVCQLKGLEREKISIWDFFEKKKHAELVSWSHTLEESNLQMDQDLLLEVSGHGFGKDSTGNSLAMVTVDPMRSNFSIAGGPTMSNGYSTGYSPNLFGKTSLSSSHGDMEDGFDGLRPSTRVENRGLAGLQNLGNTCFMNSALQCLVHTPHLVEFFLQDYCDEINKENPLGMHGELALAFGELLRKLWSSGGTPVAPRAFKGKLARFAPQFSGYNQHDSQELLAFLLDGLHEDLNRVKQKPYIETKDFDGRPDEEVANVFWSYHKARNDSIIVDICQGQYKSTLVCPTCSKISITFDPFMYLSLPLPSTATRSMTVTVFYGDGSGLPMPFTVTVPKHGCCRDLNHALGIACCLRSEECLFLAEVYENKICRYLENSDSLATIKDDELIVAYRLPNKAERCTKLEISHRHKEAERKMFLTPLMTVLEDPQSGVDIDVAIARVLSPLRRKSFISSVTIDDIGGRTSDSTEKEDEMDICMSELGSTIPSIDCMEPEGITCRELTFRIFITNEKGVGWTPVMNNTPIRPLPMVKVIVDWSDTEHALYDASYLKDLPVVQKSGVIAKKTKQEAISLFSCLDAFLKEEPLGPDDMWYCPRCRQHRQASKKLDLWRLPDVLVFHLKRFSYSRWLKNKLDTYVNFPIHCLDLSKYVKSNGTSEGSYVYDLFAISNHYGGLGGGHYSAYCKLIDENRWYHFDDSHVSPVNESDIKTSAAYVLFYQRVKKESIGRNSQPSGH